MSLWRHLCRCCSHLVLRRSPQNQFRNSGERPWVIQTFVLLCRKFICRVIVMISNPTILQRCFLWCDIANRLRIWGDRRTLGRTARPSIHLLTPQLPSASADDVRSALSRHPRTRAPPPSIAHYRDPERRRAIDLIRPDVVDRKNPSASAPIQPGTYVFSLGATQFRTIFRRLRSIRASWPRRMRPYRPPPLS